MRQEIDKFILSADCALIQALVAMDAAGQGFMAVCGESRHMQGVLTDGDIRRALLRGVDLQSSISEVYNKTFIQVERAKATDELVKELFKTTPAQQIPVCDHGTLVDIIFEEQFLLGEQMVSVQQISESLPVVIMAGGKGTRMAPFTHILPKPLIPIGNRAMIEVIMDEYVKFGMSEFYVSLNHKSRIIKAYFEEQSNRYNISFVEESMPLGTAGALKLLEEKITTPFFVSNCDVLIRADYSKIYDFHRNGGFDLTIVASIQNHTVPYGVCKADDEGLLVGIEEKPSYEFLVNTGMYLLNPSVIGLIPKDEFFHITHLIEALQVTEKKVGVFSVSEKAYVDVGQWDEYRDALRYLSV